MASVTIRDPNRARRAVLAALALGLAAAGAATLRSPADPVPAPAPRAVREPSPTPRPDAAATGRVEIGAPVVAVEGTYTAVAGTRLTFDLKARLDTELARRNGGARERNAVELDGGLEVTILDRRDDEAVIAVRFPDLRASSANAESGDARATLRALAEALQRPVQARIDTTGRVRGYRFPAEFGFVEKGQVRAVLASVRFIVPHEAAADPAWTVLDRDDTGEFEAEYRWVDRADPAAARIARRRTRSTQPAVRASGSDVQVAIEGDSVACMSAEVGWLVGAAFDDRTVVSLDAMQIDVRASCSGALTLSSTDRMPCSALPRVDWDGPWESVGGDLDEGVALAEARQREQWRARLEGVALQDLVSRLSSLVAAGAADGEDYRDTWERLARLLELDPELAAEVAAWLAPGALDEATASGLLTALGCAGTTQAQQALVQIHGDASAPAALRGTATMALLQVQRPTTAALEAMLRSAGEADLDLKRLSLMVLGTLAPRAADPLGDGRRAVDALLALEAGCRDAGTLDAWVHALGNSGVPALAAQAERFADSDDEQVRHAAVAALRAARSPSTESLLAHRATTDSSATVRFRAAESLAEHGTETARLVLCAVLRDDEAAEVRETAMLGLAQRLDATAREALQHAARQDPSAELRALASRLLAGA